MKHSTSIIVICLSGLALWVGCQKEKEVIPYEQPSLIPIFDLGDTVRSHFNMTHEELNIVIDSGAQTNFKIISEHYFDPNNYDTYFIWVDMNIQDPVRVLDSTVKTGYSFQTAILTTFEYGDTIKPTIAEEGIFSWFPKTVPPPMWRGYFKYHIYTADGGGTQHNSKVGENYIGFKFGDTGNEKLGWFNIVYQDSLCYVKEGYYRAAPNEEIVVGVK